MSVAILGRRCSPRIFFRLNICRFASSEEVRFEPVSQDDVDEARQEDDNIIQQLRNKSNLGPSSYRKIHKKPPSLTDDEKQVFSLRRLRKIYGEHGSASGLSVGLLWPSKEEMELQKEWERVAYPHNALQMIEIARNSQLEEEQKILQRQEDMARKVAKLEDWKQEVKDRVAKQKKLARETREKKERMLEEVRQMFGFHIDHKDERFKEALKKKEQEEKKAVKAAKKLKQQLKLMENIKKMAQEGSTKQEDGNSGTDLQGTSVVHGMQPPVIPKS